MAVPVTASVRHTPVSQTRRFAWDAGAGQCGPFPSGSWCVTLLAYALLCAQSCRATAAEKAEAVDLDEEIDAIGVGSFHWIAGCVCGIANAADAVELMSVSFILDLVTDIINPSDSGSESSSGSSDASANAGGGLRCRILNPLLWPRAAPVSPCSAHYAQSHCTVPPGLLIMYALSMVPRPGVLSASVFVGMLLGGLVAGSVADRIGRKPCLLISLIINAVFAILSAFATGTVRMSV